MSIIDIENLDSVSLGTTALSASTGRWNHAYLRCEDGRMFVDAQCAQSVRSSLNSLYALVHAYVPQLDFTTSTAAHKLSLTATLQMYIGDPLLVLFPDLYHGGRRFLALVIHADRTITKTRNEHIALDLVRCQ